MIIYGTRISLLADLKSNYVLEVRNALEPKRRQQRSSEVRKNGLLPLVSALKAAAAQNVASFHFPGHNRGHAAPSSLTQLIGLRPFIHDLAGLPELGTLFSPEGPILEAQKLAAELFGSQETWFLVGGTTCGIQAAIMATCSPGEHLILPRNSHISTISAMVLSGAIPKYIIPEYNCHWDIAGGITPSQVNVAIKELENEGQKPAAVFVTSPTYHGICSNLSEISKLCHSSGIPLIVDEAHGAHLGFHSQMPHSALQQGADLVVQSTHKVLCSFIQSSMLHMSGNLVDREKICRSLQTLQSTSPSHLLLASLDAARAQLDQNPETIFNRAMKLATEAKFLIKKISGITLLELPSFPEFPAIDPLRLTVGFWHLGLSGREADGILYRKHRIVPELVGRQSITFAINLGTCKEHVRRLVSGLQELSACSLQNETTETKVKDGGHEPFRDISTSLNPRDAFFANKRKVSIGESLGKVCGELICPFPPGIPVMIPGEIIGERALDYLLDARRKGAVVTGASDPLLSSIIICDV
ncbi:arginine decarboxylase [Manihot esculenta]|nr:arginine decarboxylase [Manihot esculenta]